MAGSDHPRSWTLTLPDEPATEALGRRLAPVVGSGDAIFLSGPLGAGKSALARALISGRLSPGPGGIPSPSYTLVNVYDAGGLEIWHADLYRLGEGSDLDELGLDDAWDDALVLVEWPDRLGDAVPERRLEIALAPMGEGRRATITPRGGGWEQVEWQLREEP